MRLFKKIKSMLVPNVKEVIWMHWSTKSMAAAVAIPILWGIMPDDWKPFFPRFIPQSMAYITGGLGLLSIGLKLIKQDLPSDTEPKP